VDVIKTKLHIPKQNTMTILKTLVRTIGLLQKKAQKTMNLKFMLLSFLTLFISPVFSQSPGGVSTNLQLWLKANAGTNMTTNGASVNAWADQSTEGNDALTDGADPRYSTTSSELINYNPVINFTETNREYLNIASTLNISEIGLNDFTLFGLSRYLSGQLVYLGGQKRTAGTPPPQGAMQFGVRNNVASDVMVWKYNGNDCNPVNGLVGLYPTGTDFVAISKVTRLGQIGRDYVNDKAGNITNCSRNVANVNVRIGAGGGASQDIYSTQNMGEVIAYEAALSDADQRKVDSYLAIKYGLTLDNSEGGNHGDYEATDATLLWDASLAPSYQNDIISLGRDDGQALLQKQSHTLDDSVRVYLNSLEQRNELNTGSFSNDISYLIIGSNDGTMCDNRGATTEVPLACGIHSRLEREWKVSKTNMTELFNLDFKLGPCQTTNLITANNLRLLVDDDGDFSNGGTTCYSNSDGTGLLITYVNGEVSIANISGVHISNNNTRFMTIASVDAFLPVSLKSFEANCTQKEVQLNWRTASELNNDYFRLERSSDAINFEMVADIIVKEGTSTGDFYAYTDTEPLEGVNYYRLKQVDLDGSMVTYPIITTTCAFRRSNKLLIFPNPFENELTISDLSNFSFPIRIELYDTRGALLYQKWLQEECTQISLSIGNSLAKGVYVVKITNSEIGYSKKVVKK
jgi:hypothetical protein